jgi:glycosyltransferase involved in cell wall biosynthesis
MRILMAHHDPASELSGAGHMARRTADALAARGHDVLLSLGEPTRRPVVWRPEALATWAYEVESAVGGAGLGGGWWPQVVHVTDLADPAAGVWGRGVADETGAVFAVTPATDAALWRDRELGAAIAREADVVFALTPTEGHTLAGLGVRPERIVPLGQGPQLSGRPDPTGFRDRVGATGALVLFLGRRLPTKGYQHLIAATPAIVSRHPGTTVVIAGPGDGRDEGAAGLCQLGALDEAEKHSALVAADLLCLPTVADAFPLVFVEAWWCGTPVVSGPFPGAREVVRDGVDGVVVPADPESVAAAVNDLLADGARHRAMGRAGALRARSELGWDAVAAAAEHGYRADHHPHVTRRS